MRTLLLLILMSAWPCLAQEIPPAPQQSPADPQQTGPRQQVPAAQPDTPQPDPTITVPEGTRMQLALANPISRRNAHVGDSVRAVTTFPVTVGQDLAIPQGAFFEGRIARVGKHGSTRFDGLVIEFKQVIFSNGYNAALDGSVVDAQSIAPATDPSRSTGAPGLIGNSFQQQPTPTPPPPPQVGPPQGPIIGAVIGGTVAVVVAAIFFGHRHSAYFDQGRDFDTGFQFEIVLKAPLTLERARVAATLSAAGAN